LGWVSDELKNGISLTSSAKPLDETQDAELATPALTPGGREAWYAVFVLTLCFTLSFVDRQILSLLVIPIKHDLAITDTRLALLQGLAFALFFTTLGIPLGRLADIRSRRNIIAIGVLLWSLMTALCSLANGFGSLFVARMGVGVGEATLSPAAFSLIADSFAGASLGTAMSVYSMGIFVGAGLALLVGGAVVQSIMRNATISVPVLGQIASWRGSFLVVAAPGILAVLLVLTIREPVRRLSVSSTDGSPNSFSFWQIFGLIAKRWRSTIGLTLGMICQSGCFYALLAWAPAHFQRVDHWSIARVGRSLGPIILIFGCVGMYCGGVLCDRWLKRGVYEGPLRVATLSALGTGTFFGVAFLMKSPTLALILLCPAFWFLALPNGPLFAAIQLMYPSQARGQVSATMIFANLGALIWGPLVPALISDHIFRNTQMIGASLALTVAAASLCMLAIFPLTYASYRQDVATMRTV
jgi:MFS family permease